MKFHLVKCLVHGWLVCNADNLLKAEKVKIPCTLGDNIIADTRYLPLYEGDEIHLPDNQLMNEEQRLALLKSGKMKLIEP